MRSCFISLLIILLSFNFALSQEQGWVDPLVEILHGSSYQDICIEGDRLYAASTYGLDIFDISEPAEMVLLGRAPSPRGSENVAVKDSFVFLVDWKWGMQVLDARDPQNISVVFEHRNTSHYFESVQIHNDRLYLCEGQRGVWIYDISNPEEPERLTRYQHPTWPGAVLATDSLTYVLDLITGYLFIADLRDLDDMRTLEQVEVGNGYYMDMELVDGVIYFTRGSEGVTAFNVSDLDDIYRLWDISYEDDWVSNIGVKDGYVYVCAGSAGINVYDLTDIWQPELVFSDDTTLYYSIDIQFKGDYFYASGSWSGLAAYSNNEPTEPELSGEFSTGVPPTNLTADGDHLFMADGLEGLLIYDVSDPADPLHLTTIDTVYALRVVSSDDGWLYVVSYDTVDQLYSLEAWDISDSEDPFATFKTNVERVDEFLKINGDVLYISETDVGVSLWNIENRDEPVHLGDIHEGIGQSHLRGDYLYVNDNDGLFRIIDISNPAEPEVLGEYNRLDVGLGISVDAEKAYVADGANGFHVLNVTDPQSIRRTYTAPTEDWATDLVIDDTLLYVCDSYGGLRVFDLYSAGIPYEIGYLDTPGWTYRVEVDNGIAYVVDYYDITICRYNAPTGVFEYFGSVPNSTSLQLAYPNPFNMSTTLQYNIDRSSNVTLSVFDQAGRLVEIVREGYLPRGSYREAWNASDIPAGNYFIKLNTGQKTQTRKISLVK